MGVKKGEKCCEEKYKYSGNDNPRLTQHQMLELIEAMTFPDIAMSDKDKLETIYGYAHVAVGRCKNPHDDWMDDAVKTYEDLKKAGLI